MGFDYHTHHQQIAMAEETTGDLPLERRLGRVGQPFEQVAHALGFGFTKGLVFDFVFGGDSFSFQQGLDIGGVPNVAGHSSGRCRSNA